MEKGDRWAKQGAEDASVSPGSAFALVDGEMLSTRSPLTHWHFSSCDVWDDAYTGLNYDRLS